MSDDALRGVAVGEAADEAAQTTGAAGDAGAATSAAPHTHPHPHSHPHASAPDLVSSLADAAEAQAAARELPSWLLASEAYEPPADRDSFITRSTLSMMGVLRSFRMDDGRASRFSASAPMKLVFALALILLNSLSTNFAFTLALLACVLVRAALLRPEALKRTAGVAAGAAALAFVIMLPALLFGQSRSAVLIATKTLVSAGLAMEVVCTTPVNELTAGLRAFHVPNVFIMTIDLAMKNIVGLGKVAVEVLNALGLRSVGRNRDKGASIGGIGGIVLLKTKESADDTYAAMTCRGFEGDYSVGAKRRWWRPIDAAWLVALVAIVTLFVYLQGVA